MKYWPLLVLLGCSEGRIGPYDPCHGREPGPEICDGIDNDCDGHVDGMARACWNLCGTGVEVCLGGLWAGCTAPLPVPEKCDGRDNDCDGRIDEPEDFPLQACWDSTIASPERAYFGVCRPGLLVACTNICRGAVYPSPEVCDGLDNDCDGQTDEADTPKPVEVAVVIDNSGSMYGDGQLANTDWAVREWAASRAEIRGAIVVAGDAPTLRMATPLVSRDEFLRVWPGAVAYDQNGWAEPTLDGARLAILDAGWTDAPKHLFIFTDENPQTYHPPYPTTGDIANLAADAGVQVSVFTDLSFPGARDWSVAGTVFDLLNDRQKLLNRMQDLARPSICP